MDDNKNQNQTNPATSDYQKILDEYAASVKPEDNQNPETKTEAEPVNVSLKETPPATEPEKADSLIDDLEQEIIKKTPHPSVEKPSTPELKSVNSPQLEAPIHPSLAANLEADDDQIPAADQTPVSAESADLLPPLPPKETPVLNHFEAVNGSTPEPSLETPQADVKPEKSPEEIKAEINRLLTEDETKPNDSGIIPTKTAPPVSRVFFAFALILFLIVGAALAYFLFLSPSTQTNTTIPDTSVIPTVSETENIIDTDEICELNDRIYQVGESFASADGCNTCTCTSTGVIACTEKACIDIPTVIPATSSADTKTVITPTKVATPSTETTPVIED